ncbi:MAG: hypothetical protein GKR94_01615 [Gammaproteobacteria bacterium]|nr:hypothetical protein [Gammaproteobacteria bacterium]
MYKMWISSPLGIKAGGPLTGAGTVDGLRSVTINGYAAGIGCIVTFCCDLIIASERAE